MGIEGSGSRQRKKPPRYRKELGSPLPLTRASSTGTWGVWGFVSSLLWWPWNGMAWHHGQGMAGPWGKGASQSVPGHVPRLDVMALPQKRAPGFKYL